MRRPFKSILVTGGSSGIGRALAWHYAAPGVCLTITGRDRERLAVAREALEARGASVAAMPVSVTDAAAMEALIREAEARRPLDLVVANAGVSGGTGGSGGEGAEQTRRITAVNVEGVVNTIEPAVAAFRQRRSAGPGLQLALLSSLAGFRGYANAPAYCASKAWVRIWGEALRADLRPLGVGVSVICPGFVESRITAVNDFPMPMLWTAEKAAVRIAQGLARNKRRIAFPLPLYLASLAVAALPAALVDWAERRVPAKPPLGQDGPNDGAP